MNLARMGKTELLDLCKQHRLEVSDDPTREEMIAALKKGNVSEESGYANPDQLSGEKIVVLIAKGDPEKGEDQPVTVGLNGKVWVIPRGQEHELPAEVYAILKNAVQTHFKRAGTNPDGTIKYEEINNNRFPMQVGERIPAKRAA